MNPLQFIKKAPWRKIAIGAVFLFVLVVTLIVLAGAWFSYQGGVNGRRRRRNCRGAGRR